MILLPEKINQISGIVYQPGHFVFAVDDDHGSIYKIPLVDNPKPEEWKVGKNDDFEGLALVGNFFYVLSSKGTLTSVKATFPLGKAKRYTLKLEGKNEFEILYFDPTQNRVVLLCKECEGDKKEENTAWAFDPDRGQFDKNPIYRIHRKDIEQKLGKNISRFKPSAGAIHPVTKELYLVSSINKLLVVLDSQRKVLFVQQLDARLFKQPEGLAFTPSGDLLIANESAGKGPATILLFDRKN